MAVVVPPGVRVASAVLAFCLAVFYLSRPPACALLFSACVTFATQALVPASSEYYRSASLWATVVAVLAASGAGGSVGGGGSVLIHCTLPALACVLNAKRLQLIKEVFAWSTTSRVAGLKCAQFQQRLARKSSTGFDEVRNESFYVVEHEISLQRTTIEEAEKQARAEVRDSRVLVGGVCLLFNVVTGGLFWRVRLSVLSPVVGHIALTLASCFSPADTLPDGEIGANAAAVALGAGDDTFLLPAYSFILCLVSLLSTGAPAAVRAALIATHAACTAVFRLRRPAFAAHVLFGVAVIYAVVDSFIKP